MDFGCTTKKKRFAARCFAARVCVIESLADLSSFGTKIRRHENRNFDFFKFVVFIQPDFSWQGNFPCAAPLSIYVWYPSTSYVVASRNSQSLTLLTRADMSTVRFRRTKVRFRGRNMILRFQFTKCGFCADGNRRRLRVYSLHAARSLAGVAFVPTQLCPQPLAVFTSLCYYNTCGRMSYL